MKTIKVLGSGCKNCETTAKLIQVAAARRPELEATDHYLFINPWPRLPLKVETVALRCLVVLLELRSSSVTTSILVLV